MVESLRRSFRTGKTIPLSQRKESLKNLLTLINENNDEICEAIYKDLHRSKAEAYCYEVLFAINEINGALKDLDTWAKPKKVKKNLLQAMDKAYIVKDPLGVVLIIAPWNYPINLLFCPLVGALAAGNVVVLKPSECAPNTAAIVERLIPKYFDPEIVRVVTGGVPETTELLKERYDHIFYTGSPNVGKIVMQAASKHLTPVTLELGGKSPVIVDKDSDLYIAGRRIAWGKYMSCGQTCLAPDYILCHESVKTELIENIKKATKEYYTDNPQKAPDYSRIINERNFDRLLPLLQSGKTVFGGKHDRKDLYIEPTILDDVKFSDPIMQDEIFGPILPIVTFKNIDTAIEYVNDHEKPLAIYLFSKNQTLIDDILKRTSCGGVCINDCILHMALETLPFGGVGNSGMGRYHGSFTFDCFTHEKSVLQRRQGGEKVLWMRYPPYDDAKFYWSKQLGVRRSLPTLCCLYWVPMLVVGFLLGYLVQKLT